MERVETRANDLRIGLSKLCADAGVSRTVAYRWQAGREVVPLLPTIGKLEAQLSKIEHERTSQ